MSADLQTLQRLYDAYVDTFRAGGELPPMMRLKREHTAFVVANARAIAAGEGFDARTARAAEAAALLHDTGRYEQLRRYNTFRDSDSVDHAVFSHDIVREQGWLRDWPGDEAEAILERQVATTDWRRDSTAFWNLPVSAPPNPAVVEAIVARRPVDYQNIKSLADFVLIQVGWMASGLRYATSRRLVSERGHLEWRRGFLHELTDAPAVDVLCDMASAALEEERIP